MGGDEYNYKTRAYRVWTQEAEQALRDGVKQHGLGAWESVRRDPQYSELLGDRTGVQLKDKWRNLVKFRHIGADEQKKYRPTGNGPWSDHRSKKYKEALGSDDAPSLPRTPSLLKAESLPAEEQSPAPQQQQQLQLQQDPGPPSGRRVQRQSARAAILRKVWSADCEPEGPIGEAEAVEVPPPVERGVVSRQASKWRSDPGSGGEGGTGGTSSSGRQSSHKRRRRVLIEDRRFGIYDQRRYKTAVGGSRGDSMSGSDGLCDDEDDEAAGPGPGSEDAFEINCCCGVRHDDGEMMIECETCKVWSHVECLRKQLVAVLPDLQRQGVLDPESLYQCLSCRLGVHSSVMGAATRLDPALAACSDDGSEREHEVGSVLLGLANSTGAESLGRLGYLEAADGRDSEVEHPVPPHAVRRPRAVRTRRASGGWGDQVLAELHAADAHWDGSSDALTSSNPGVAGSRHKSHHAAWRQDGGASLHIGADIDAFGHVGGGGWENTSGSGPVDELARLRMAHRVSGMSSLSRPVSHLSGLAAPRPRPHPAMQHRTSDESLRTLAGDAHSGRGLTPFPDLETRSSLPGLSRNLVQPMPRAASHLAHLRSLHNTSPAGGLSALNGFRRHLSSGGGASAQPAEPGEAGLDGEGAWGPGSNTAPLSPRTQQQRQREEDEASALAALESLRSGQHSRAGTPSLAHLESLLRATPQPSDMSLPMLLSNASMASALHAGGGGGPASMPRTPFDGTHSPTSPTKLRKAAAKARAMAAAAVSASGTSGSHVSLSSSAAGDGGRSLAGHLLGLPLSASANGLDGLERSHPSTSLLEGLRPLTPDPWNSLMMMRTGTPTPEALALNGFALPPGHHSGGDFNATPWLLSHTPPLADLLQHPDEAQHGSAEGAHLAFLNDELLSRTAHFGPIFAGEAHLPPPAKQVNISAGAGANGGAAGTAVGGVAGSSHPSHAGGNVLDVSDAGLVPGPPVSTLGAGAAGPPHGGGQLDGVVKVEAVPGPAISTGTGLPQEVDACHEQPPASQGTGRCLVGGVAQPALQQHMISSPFITKPVHTAPPLASHAPPPVVSPFINK